ncbi:MAG: twin-arginine translocase TatA/TatE family subunit [Chloroflexi bacterium]|nr:twin-arginine translocase TatA/TatE family subunit [Chloroflexota bacterium]
MPEIGRTIGKGMREFRKSQSGLDEFKSELIKPIESIESKEEKS